MRLIHRFWEGAHRPEHIWTARAVESVHGQAPHDWSPGQLRGTEAPQLWGDDVRHASNVTRYWLLYTYGGLWLDHDVIPLADLRSDEPYTAGMGDTRVGCVLNFPEPGHPMLAELLDAAKTRTGTAPERSGGRLLTEVGRSYDVAIADDVLPFDRDGIHRPEVVHPKAVHLWESSFANAHGGRR